MNLLLKYSFIEIQGKNYQLSNSTDMFLLYKYAHKSKNAVFLRQKDGIISNKKLIIINNKGDNIIVDTKIKNKKQKYFEYSEEYQIYDQNIVNIIKIVKITTINKSINSITKSTRRPKTKLKDQQQK